MMDIIAIAIFLVLVVDSSVPPPLSVVSLVYNMYFNHSIIVLVVEHVQNLIIIIIWLNISDKVLPFNNIWFDDEGFVLSRNFF